MTDIQQQLKSQTEINRRESELLLIIGHQLRSPVTSVNQALKLVRLEEINPQDRERLLFLAEGCSERLIAIVEKMFDLARLEDKLMVTVHQTPVNVTKIVKQAVLNHEIMASDRNIRIQGLYPVTELKVKTDDAKLSEALSNYLENAIKYSDVGSAVKIHLKNDQDWIYIEVQNRGLKVTKTEKPKMFSKFFRGRAAQGLEPEGCGIGLFITKLLIESLGGQVYYRGIQQGNVFGLKIPNDK